MTGLFQHRPQGAAQFSRGMPAAGESSRSAATPELHVVQGAGAATVTDAPAQHILYVDDEESLVYLVKRLLERQGYAVTGFIDAMQALAQLQRSPDAFQAVITDLSMPGMSGVEFAREVLKLRPGIPVVMTSGYVRAEDHDAVMASGVRELLLKPNTVEELAEVLHRLLQQTSSSPPRPTPMQRSLGTR